MRGGADERHAQGAGAAAAEPADLALDGLGAGDQVARTLEQDLPGGGQPDPGEAPVDERGVELALEGCDLAAQRRLCHVEPRRRPAEVALLGDRDEVLQPS